jgi:hypothetical protein
MRSISGVFNSLNPIASTTILDLSIDEDLKND